MDEVLADALGELLARYNRERHVAVSRKDVEGKWLWQALPRGDQKLIDGYLQSPDFFEDLPVIPGSQEVLLRMSHRYEIFIATAAMAFPNSFDAKYRWLRRHFNFLSPQNFVFCGDKSVLRTDFLIDDMPHNLAAFQGQGILFTAPHNVGISTYRRANSWQDIDAMFPS